MVVPNVELIFSLTGSTASVAISYLLPSLLFLRMSRRKGDAGESYSCSINSDTYSNSNTYT